MFGVGVATKVYVQRQLFFPMDDNYFSLCTTTTATSC